MNRSPILPLSLICLSAIAVCASAARAQDGSSAQSEAVPTPVATQPAPKKVWTTEDLQALHDNSPVSTVGKPTGTQTTTPQAHTTPAARQNQKWYSDQITKFQAQLPRINDKIAQIQAAVDGKFTGDLQTSTRPRYAHLGDWQAELKQLQSKRDDIEAQINALRDQARRAGVSANRLPQ
jgi:hypothetical protein